jgi:pimeloyl-ACP methyl ester carboxylesterase
MLSTKKLYVTIIIAVLYTVMISPVAYLVLLLVLHGITAEGCLFGLGTFLLLASPLLYVWNRLSPGKISKDILTFVSGNGILLYIICFVTSPSGYNPPEVNVQSHYIKPARYHRLSIANFVPEIDQLLLGSYVMPLIDPYLDTRQAERVRQVFLDVYRPMRENREFNELGSVLGYAYRDMFFGPSRGKHFYEYIPVTSTNGPVPVIMFLHGSLGNFKGYLWVLKSLADRKGMAIIAPTFGVGNWHKPGGTNLVECMKQYCSKHPRLDEHRIYLAGLSNGGRGVTRVAKNNPDAYQGLILLSAVIEPAVIMDREFVHGWRNKPILIIHGTQDRRLPLSYVKSCAEIMKRNGSVVTAEYYPEEDHFLFFSAGYKVCHDIGKWMDR